jgi:hypothetical protein
LLQVGEYDSSYIKRVKQFVSLFPYKPELINLANWALSEKLRPQAVQMSSKDFFVLYQNVHNFFFQEMYIALSEYYNIKISNPTNIEFCLKWKPISILKRIYHLVVLRNLSFERNLNLVLAQTYIAAAWAPESTNQQWLSSANKFLKKIDKTFCINSSWEDARALCAQLRSSVQ